jgi:hypothetical protein
VSEDRCSSIVSSAQVITGTGDTFMDAIDGDSLREVFNPTEWDKIYWEGRRVLQRLVELERSSQR